MSGRLNRILLYILVLCLPIIIFMLLQTETDHGFIYELGRGFATLGISILTLQIALSSRIKWIVQPFGFDRIIQFHRYMGPFAVLLIVLHPILLGIGGGAGWLLITATSVPWYIWLARGLILLLLVHGITAVFRKSLKIEYQKWIRYHSIFSIIIVVGAFLHSWFAGEDLKFLGAQIVWIGLVVLALSLYSYIKFIRPNKSKIQLNVADVIPETHNVFTLKLTPVNGSKLPDYIPGQFHFLTLQRSSELPEEEHPFTISSSPTENEFISSTIKKSGDFTATIDKTRKGDKAFVHAPFGHFSYVLNNHKKNMVFLAGGVGITPLMSMLRHMRDKQSDHKVVLLYANKNEDDIIFKNELKDMEKEDLPHVRVIHVLSQPNNGWKGEAGHINQDIIKKYCDEDLMDNHYYVCGPPAMNKSLITTLKDMGIPSDQVFYEHFSL